MTALSEAERHRPVQRRTGQGRALVALFLAVEAYDRKVGQLQEIGLMPRHDPG